MIQKNTTVYTNKNVSLDLMLLSDFHADINTDFSSLYKAGSFVKKDVPNYILILGDMLDDGLDYETAKKMSDLLYFYGKSSPVIMINGNHDVITKENGKCKFNFNDEERKIYNEISSLYSTIPNLYFLDNQKCSFSYLVCFYGANPDASFYSDEEHGEKVLENSVINKFNDNFNGQIYNIFLSHSPRCFMDNNFTKKYPLFDNIDLFLSGHMHNGLVPIYLEKFFPKDYGLFGFSSGKKVLFPRLTRGKVNINENSLGIITNPWCTISNSKGILRKVNKLFPPVAHNVKIRKLVK